MDDPHGLASAANRLLTEPGLRERLGRQARQRAREEFADDLMARRSLAFYRDVLAEAPAALRVV
jgi:glycosyltransferase involved in cell wall biosynthesis